MSKHLVLGDIHGRTIWRDIVNLEKPDKIIFLGDYVTTHEDISPEQQLANLEDILQYKEDRGEAVILLRGNHCLDCLGYSWAECYPTEPKVKEVMAVDPLKSRFLNLTQWVYIDEELKTVFSHAGISQRWMDDTGIKSIYDINNFVPSELFGFTPDSRWDNNGSSVTQPLTWIRPQALCKCNVKGWTQVIGHTPVYNITDIYKATKHNEHIWCCDALGVNQYLVIDNGNFIIKTIKDYESTNL